MTSDLNLLPISKECEPIKLHDMDLLLRDQRNIYCYNEEEEDSNEEEDTVLCDKPMCGCGTLLSSGWDCAQCRYNCTTCHRAVILGEECSRCNVEHNTKFMTSPI
ncbi:unnamed protein product [Mucor hiemalis]